MTKISGTYHVAKANRATNPTSVERGIVTEIDKIRELLATLEAQGISDWQILSTWSALLHEQGEFQKGEVLSMATQMFVEIEEKTQEN
jgi:hypothetical protein